MALQLRNYIRVCMEALSDQIRAAIEDCGLTRYRIAELTGVSAASLCRFVSGQTGLNLDAVDRIAELLQVEIRVRGPHADVLRKYGARGGGAR